MVIHRRRVLRAASTRRMQCSSATSMRHLVLKAIPLFMLQLLAAHVAGEVVSEDRNSDARDALRGNRSYGNTEEIILWQHDLDRIPLYLSGARVGLRVVQRAKKTGTDSGDRDFSGVNAPTRDFEWTADWYGLLQGDMNMGRMVCPLTVAERAALIAMPADALGNATVPCRSPDADGLTAGSDIVRRIGAAAAALGARRIGMVGLGPGTMATYWQRFHPQIERVDVSEMSPLVAEVAQRYFDCRPDSRLRIHIVDGVVWLKQAPQFDVFVHDASGSLHLFLWPSVLRAIEERTSGGAMLMNLMGVPALIRFPLVWYLRTRFQEVSVQDDVLIASWKPITVSFVGLPDHVQTWYNQPGWYVYPRASFGQAVLFVSCALAAWLTMVVATGVLIASAIYKSDVGVRWRLGKASARPRTICAWWPRGSEGEKRPLVDQMSRTREHIA